MPDILIRGMEMPKNCGACYLNHGEFCFMLCRKLKLPRDWDERPENCPLVELPEHGDLKDANKLLAEFERDERAADEHGREFSFSFDSGGARCTEWWIVQQKLMDAPVIVPASEEVANENP